MGSFIFSDFVSLGASGVIFAFLGIHLYLFIEYKKRYVEIFGTQVLTIIAINLIFTFTYSGIDISGHIFGLLSGMAFMAMTDINKTTMKKLLGFTFILLMFFGFAYKFYTYKGSEDYYQFKGYYLEQTGQKQELIKLMNEYNKKYNK